MAIDLYLGGTRSESLLVSRILRGNFFILVSG